MGGINEECGSRAQGVEPRPPLSVVVVSVERDAVEVHLPPACPKRTPLLRVDVDDRAYHVAAILGAPPATAEARHAGTAGVAAARAEEDRGRVDI